LITSKMPDSGDFFMGEINDLVQYAADGWRRRDIIFYKSELKSKRKYSYPQGGDYIILVDIEGNRYQCNFSKPENEENVCLGTPGNLKKWYKRKKFSDTHISTVRGDGYRDKVFLGYTGCGYEFSILTKKEFRSKCPEFRC